MLHAQSFKSFPDLNDDLDTWYDSIARNSNSPILKGPYFYSSTTKRLSREQNPFYKNDWDFNGLVYFEGRQYQSMQVAYNIVKDYLLIWNWNMGKNGEKSLLINQAKIDSFYIYGEKFIYSEDPKFDEKGFYTSIMKGEKIACYARKKKTINDNDIEVKFSEKFKYYIIYKDQVGIYKGLSSFNKMFPEQKKQLRDFVRSNIGIYEKTNEYHLKAVLGFYESTLK